MHASPQVPEVLSAALEYAARGWPVFPLHSMKGEWCTCGDGRCGSKAKHPLTRSGLKEATTDEQQIRAWWKRWPFANVGVRTGGDFFVLDVDVRHAGDETLAELEREHGDLPATPRVVTGGGGAHLWFKGKASNRAGVAQGIDVRGDGGYVVAPPSLHESGKRYEWELAYHPDEVAMSEPPAWLSALVKARRAPVVDAGPAGPDKIIEGGRNNWLTSVAGKLRHAGMSGDAIGAALLVVNRERCHPPLDELDVKRIAASVARYEQGELPPNPTTEINTLWAEDMAAPLPPISWVSEQLTIAAGRATVIAGEGGSRKGWLAMAMILCGAANLKLLGRFSFKPNMRSMYIDFEQGQRATHERWQKLALGYGVRLEDMRRAWGYRWRPIPTFAPRNDADRMKAVDELCRQVEGIDFAVVDSVRASSPGVEENSVFASIPFDLTNDVSQRTGCTFAFIDHSGNPPTDTTKSARKRKHAQRGHSSKRDASQTLLVLSAEKGQPTLVTCERSQIAPEPDWPADFMFTIAGTPNGGLVLQEMGKPEQDTDPHDAKFAAMKVRIIDLLKRKPGLPSMNAICAQVDGGGKDVKLEAIRELVSEGKVLSGGEGIGFRVA